MTFFSSFIDGINAHLYFFDKLTSLINGIHNLHSGQGINLAQRKKLILLSGFDSFLNKSVNFDSSSC